MTTQLDNCVPNEEDSNPPFSPPFSPVEKEGIKAGIRKTGYESITLFIFACFRCLSTLFIRWLEVKTVLVRKNRKVAMASKRKWKKYWGESLFSCSC